MAQPAIPQTQVRQNEAENRQTDGFFTDLSLRCEQHCCYSLTAAVYQKDFTSQLFTWVLLWLCRLSHRCAHSPDSATQTTHNHSARDTEATTAAFRELKQKHLCWSFRKKLLNRWRYRKCKTEWTRSRVCVSLRAVHALMKAPLLCTRVHRSCFTAY